MDFEHNVVGIDELYPAHAPAHRLTYIYDWLTRKQIRQPSNDKQYPWCLGKSKSKEDKKIDENVSKSWTSFMEAFFLLSALRSNSLYPEAESYRVQFLIFNSNRSIREE